MTRTLKNIAALMLLVAGAITFTSCNDEEEMSQRNRLNKLDRVEDLSIFEQNGYSPDEIFSRTVEFGRYLKEDTMKNMTIEEAVVVLETYWNYGIVAKQGTLAGDYYADKDISFKVAMHGDSVDGSRFLSAVKPILTDIYNRIHTSHQIINAADVSVIAFDSENVTFNIRVLPYAGDAILSLLETRVVKEYGETISVPSDYTIEIDSLPWMYDEKSSVIPGLLKLMRKPVPNYAVNLTEEIDTKYVWQKYMPDIAVNGIHLIHIDMTVVNGIWTAPIIYAGEVKDRIIPSYLKYIMRDHPYKTLITFKPTCFKTDLNIYGNIENSAFSTDVTNNVAAINDVNPEPPKTAMFLAEHYTFGELVPKTDPIDAMITNFPTLNDIIQLWAL